MPKTLTQWLHRSALKWHIPGKAFLHNGLWHRASFDPPVWASCGKWLGPGFVTAACGKGEKYDNPWSAGNIKLDWLCRTCFADELPLLTALQKPVDEAANVG